MLSDDPEPGHLRKNRTDREMSTMETTPITYPGVLATVTALVDYLRVTTDLSTVADPSQGWIGCADLIASPQRLDELIRSTSAGRGTREEMVAASLFLHSYAFCIASAVVAPWALGLPAPSCAPANMSIKMSSDRPGQVAIADQTVADRTAWELVGELFVEHFGPLIEAVLATTTIGKRLLWGNVASACSTVFRALDGAPGADREAIQRRAADFATAAAPWIEGLGRSETVAEGGRVGWFWTRTVCCLWYRCAGGFTCDDCSLTSAEDLETSRRAQLAAAGR